MPSEEENVKYLYTVLTAGGTPQIDFNKVSETLGLKMSATNKRWSRLKIAMTQDKNAGPAAHQFVWLCLKNSARDTAFDWNTIAEKCNTTSGAAAKRYSRLKQAFESGEAMPPATPKVSQNGEKEKKPATPRKRKTGTDDEAKKEESVEGEDEVADTKKEDAQPKKKRARVNKKASTDEIKDVKEESSEGAEEAADTKKKAAQSKKRAPAKTKAPIDEVKIPKTPRGKKVAAVKEQPAKEEEDSVEDEKESVKDEKESTKDEKESVKSSFVDDALANVDEVIANLEAHANDLKAEHDASVNQLKTEEAAASEVYEDAQELPEGPTQARTEDWIMNRSDERQESD
ncbi:hypothetical protein EJ04DRAFT_583543 [Polyplosphaeria fusca]|uniref:Myb-like DNA-binding domain-containing protein n=1 Tax=Polyplosphaeria fusca TaxID=682080 RepID=A0A9P4R9X2_9PLEO|nr:hypothetical protein EJ04DRAFT_583543 [Polyplosphaeria fusca]